MRNILELRGEAVNLFATEFGFPSGGATFTIWGTFIKNEEEKKHTTHGHAMKRKLLLI